MSGRPPELTTGPRVSLVFRGIEGAVPWASWPSAAQAGPLGACFPSLTWWRGSSAEGMQGPSPPGDHPRGVAWWGSSESLRHPAGRDEPLCGMRWGTPFLLCSEQRHGGRVAGTVYTRSPTPALHHACLGSGRAKHPFPRSTQEQSWTDSVVSRHPDSHARGAGPGEAPPAADHRAPTAGREAQESKGGWAHGARGEAAGQSSLPGPVATCHTGRPTSPRTETGSLRPAPALPARRPRSWEQRLPRGRRGKRYRDPRGAHVLCLRELQVGHGWHHAQHRCARWPDTGAPPLDDLLHIPREQPRR